MLIKLLLLMLEMKATPIVTSDALFRARFVRLEEAEQRQRRARLPDATLMELCGKEVGATSGHSREEPGLCCNSTVRRKSEAASFPPSGPGRTSSTNRLLAKQNSCGAPCQ
jgi:hypothetical protein